MIHFNVGKPFEDTNVILGKVYGLAIKLFSDTYLGKYSYQKS